MDAGQFAACEACGKVRNIDAREVYLDEGNLFCAKGCDKPSDWVECVRCLEVLKEQDSYGDTEQFPGEHFCHDCLLDEIADRRERAYGNFDYRRTTA